MKNVATEKAVKISVKKIDFNFDVFVWQKICKLADKAKKTPEEIAAFFLTNGVQPTQKKAKHSA